MLSPTSTLSGASWVEEGTTARMLGILHVATMSWTSHSENICRHGFAFLVLPLTSCHAYTVRPAGATMGTESLTASMWCKMPHR